MAQAGGAGGGAGGAGGGAGGGGGERAVQGLEVRVEGELLRYREARLVAELVYSDGTRGAAEGVTFSSSDANVATVDAAGAVMGVHKGEVTFTATLGDQSATLTETVGCRYPNFPNAVRFNNAMPALGWKGAYWGDGSQLDFSFESFYCDAEWDEFDSAIVMIKAAWCAPCTQYAQTRLNPASQSLREDGALIIYVEAQDLNGLPADNDYANQHMRRIIGDGWGIRVGDASTMATVPSEVELPGYLQDTDLVVAFPTLLVLRKRDMKVIAESARTQFSLPLEAIVNDLEADWSEIVPMVRNNCGEGDEEASEPNNDFDQATEVGPGEYTGGICDAEPDVYFVNIEGAWTADILFSHATGDIDVVVLEPGNNQPLASSLTADDNEQIQFSGPAYLNIFGYNGASAPYTLNITAAE
ncbi:MAG: Ig-like domain-containing protein [Myxococcales bacterium]|nr:Ig-like domain-containing protein [Myxococcales bacterium]